MLDIVHAETASHAMHNFLAASMKVFLYLVTSHDFYRKRPW